MSAIPNHRFLLGTTALAGFDPIILAFIDDLRVREGIVDKHVGRYRGTARHFLTGLTLDSLSGPRLETVRILGKGRRDRELPLWKETKTVLNEWLDVRPPVNNRSLFLSARGRAMSTDGFAYILKQHVATAAQKVPSIQGKRVTPHVLRHSTAMTLLHATGDIQKVSLWLGHADIKTTEAYLRASPSEKLGILESNTPPSIRPGTFPSATDSLMRVLDRR